MIQCIHENSGTNNKILPRIGVIIRWIQSNSDASTKIIALSAAEGTYYPHSAKPINGLTTYLKRAVSVICAMSKQVGFWSLGSRTGVRGKRIRINKLLIETGNGNSLQSWKALSVVEWLTTTLCSWHRNTWTVRKCVRARTHEQQQRYAFLTGTHCSWLTVGETVLRNRGWQLTTLCTIKNVSPSHPLTHTHSLSLSLSYTRARACLACTPWIK